MAEFSGQREGEEVQFIFRRHFLESYKGVLIWLLLTALGGGAFWLLRDTGYGFWVFLACFLLGAAVFCYHHLLWYFSVHVVTNQRIRQIVQKGLFRRSVVDLGLDKIESVSYQVPGLLGGLLDYGTLLIQTHVGDMVITKVRHPEETYNKIQALLGIEGTQLNEEEYYEH